MMSATDPALRTEFAFVLPRGYVDEHGRTHREGVMRLATARDEIAPQVDPRVRANPAYLTVLLLERTVTHLGDLPSVDSTSSSGSTHPTCRSSRISIVAINQEGHSEAAVACPACGHEFTVDLAGDAPGES